MSVFALISGNKNKEKQGLRSKITVDGKTLTIADDSTLMSFTKTYQIDGIFTNFEDFINSIQINENAQHIISFYSSYNIPNLETIKFQMTEILKKFYPIQTIHVFFGFGLVREPFVYDYLNPCIDKTKFELIPTEKLNEALDLLELAFDTLSQFNNSVLVFRLGHTHFLEYVIVPNANTPIKEQSPLGLSSNLKLVFFLRKSSFLSKRSFENQRKLFSSIRLISDSFAGIETKWIANITDNAPLVSNVELMKICDFFQNSCTHQFTQSYHDELFSISWKVVSNGDPSVQPDASTLKSQTEDKKPQEMSITPNRVKRRIPTKAKNIGRKKIPILLPANEQTDSSQISDSIDISFLSMDTQKTEDIPKEKLPINTILQSQNDSGNKENCQTKSKDIEEKICNNDINDTEKTLQIKSVNEDLDKHDSDSTNEGENQKHEIIVNTSQPNEISSLSDKHEQNKKEELNSDANDNAIQPDTEAIDPSKQNASHSNQKPSDEKEELSSKTSLLDNQPSYMSDSTIHFLDETDLLIEESDNSEVFMTSDDENDDFIPSPIIKTKEYFPKYLFETDEDIKLKQAQTYKQVLEIKQTLIEKLKEPFIPETFSDPDERENSFRMRQLTLFQAKQMCHDQNISYEEAKNKESDIQQISYEIDNFMETTRSEAIRLGKKLKETRKEEEESELTLKLLREIYLKLHNHNTDLKQAIRKRQMKEEKKTPDEFQTCINELLNQISIVKSDITALKIRGKH